MFTHNKCTRFKDFQMFKSVHACCLVHKMFGSHPPHLTTIPYFYSNIFSIFNDDTVFQHIILDVTYFFIFQFFTLHFTRHNKFNHHNDEQITTINDHARQGKRSNWQSVVQTTSTKFASRI